MWNFVAQGIPSEEYLRTLSARYTFPVPLSLSLSLVEKHTSAENQEGGALRGNETNEKEISSPENEREKGSRIEIFKTHCSAGKGFVDLKITTGKDQSSD